MTNILRQFSFELPTRIEYGVGVISKLGDELRLLKAQKVAIITDPGIIKAGLLDKITSILKEEKLLYNVFDGVDPNPKDQNVERGAQVVRSFGADAMVAISGGSVIDCAKAIGVLVSHDGKRIKDFEGKTAVKKQILPFIAIPTTAGTGSEVTFSAVITDTENNYKMTVRSPFMAAKVALLDPKLTVTVPPHITASTGMDALTHAIEAYTVKVSEPVSDALALYAIELISNNLVNAVKNGEDIEARACMLVGSLLAGIAFSHSDVGSVHCMAEALGGVYDAPHGICNAVLLPYVMEYNVEFCIEKYARIAKAMGETFETSREGAMKAVERIKKLATEVGLPSFKSLGVKEEDLEKLADMAAKNISTESNPREMTKEDYLTLFRRAMAD
ncbi:iron-containing alcohol dehydrogenase [Acetomicrobium sp.]|uniref:iron-containing alcohol dehydrogenase n=1 Tax=Acetomicrobium sp. TaxID=1872099 RepID=UPI0028719903|nr:iron-containing alcohol dehydrogenase [Acetomicrobium sp.]MDR9769043.1 iron-containing alcohol dehydrogenase [Acetomicrobium sp.]